MPAPRSPPRPQTLQTAQIPAPVGGFNAVDVGSAMPALDCPYSYNLIRSEQGLRVRLGYREWATGLAGSADSQVRTVLPYLGSTSTAHRLFAVTSTGIWDVTESDDYTVPPAWAPGTDYDAGDLVTSNGNTYSADIGGESGANAPEDQTTWYDGNMDWTFVEVHVVAAVTFGTQTGMAGYGVSHAVVTAGGHFLLYADEANGLYKYTESTDTWAAVTDITGVNEADIRFVAVFKNRVWLLEKDSQKAWYLDAGAISGAATQFPFTAGGSFRHGGHIVGLYNWTYDGGAGIDDALVAISSGGDILVYQGTNPAVAADFGLKGVWFCGGVPAGRRIATDYGGELLIMSILGVLPLSKLVLGASIEDAALYATEKIGPYFNLKASTNKALKNWSIHIHPTDNALLITVPTAPDTATEQLAMAFGGKAWGVYRDLPIFSAGVWDGQMYFGTTDGRICINDGYVDGVELADPSAYTPVSWSVLTAFRSLENASHKQIRMVQPTILSQTPNPTVGVTAKYDFDISEPAAPVGTGPLNGTWGTAEWDEDVWGGDYVSSQPIIGTVGMGRDVAVALRGTAIGRTTLVGMKVWYELGGTL
jgi:hypothetical protein